ncbi:MAG: glycosyltransferase [Smithellaceae bacterium]
MPHILEETDILFYLTNLAMTNVQRHLRVASSGARVTVVYWKRPDINFPCDLSDRILTIPVEAAFFNHSAVGRMVAFLIFALKSWRLLRRARGAKKVYVNYLDVLGVASLALWKKDVAFIYSVADLSPVQYGRRRWLNATVARAEKWLIRKVRYLILTSPFFWSEYYSKIYSGRWHLIENLPEAKVWENFRRRERRGDCVIGYIGWIRECRPVACLFEAVAQLRAENYDVSVFFAGFGPEEAEVKALAKGRNDILFYGPYAYEQDIANLYGRVDMVFAVYDATVANSQILMPHRFYEAVICGLPILAARGTKLAERVDALGVGYTVDCLSTEQMKAALMSHLTCDSHASRISASLKAADKSAYFYDQYDTVLSEIFAIATRKDDVQ